MKRLAGRLRASLVWTRLRPRLPRHGPAVQRARVAGGSEIDRERPIAFTFDGRKLTGYAGDTLASALLANGVRLVGRSVKRHRPRGIVGIGPEEPNALVEIGRGAERRPNLRATEVPLTEGLVARSQNAWPHRRFDAGAVFGWAAPLLPAGFQYKTFKWPRRLWPFYERVLRRMAGLGRAPVPPGPAGPPPLLRHFHVDVLVAGGGPAGLAAAEAASREGARVLLAEAGAAFGGRLRDLAPDLDARPAATWLGAMLNGLRQRPGLRLLTHASVLGAYDHGLWTVAETVPDAMPRLWLVRARAAVIATGAIERPLLFAGNDRPGVMQAAAVRGYLHRHGVLCGRRPLLFGADDDLYLLAAELERAGAEVAGIVDPRETIGGPAVDDARAAGIPIFAGHVIAQVLGRAAVTGVRLRRRGGETALSERVRCDLVAVHGGWTPAVHLFAQAGRRLAWDEDREAAVPVGDAAPALQAAGAICGDRDLARAVNAGGAAGLAALRAAGYPVEAPAAPPAAPIAPPAAPVLPADGWSQAFIDQQNDVTLADLALAAREGYGAPELAKRYTALGMGTEQGKLGNAVGQQALAILLGSTPAAIGGTTFRPPWVPVDLPLLAAGAADEAFTPLRRSAADDWHEAHGAAFVEAAGWRRPNRYGRGEAKAAVVREEALALHRSVGMVDMGPIGRITIAGRDAALFMDRICGAGALEPGRARRVLLLREDGRIRTQAIAARLPEPAGERFVLTLPPGRDLEVLEQLGFLAEARWPQLAVHVVPVSEQWFAVALIGPRCRALLFDLTDEIDVGNAAFPPLAIRTGRVAGLPAEVLSHGGWGEVAFEVAVPADHGLTLWNAVLAAGARHRLRPCGVAALELLRIAAGRPGPAEIDGRTTPADLGIAVSARVLDRIGLRALALPALADPARPQLVGLVGLDPAAPIPRGAQLVAERRPGPQPILGHVTSHAIGPIYGRPIGLGLLGGGRTRYGTELFAASPLLDRWSPVRIVPPGNGEDLPNAGEALRGGSEPIAP